MKNNYKNMSVEELISKEKELSSALFNLTFQKKVGQLQNTASIRETKREIARVKTELNAKKLAGAKE